MKINVALIGLGNAFYRKDKFKNYTHSNSLRQFKKNFKLIYAIDPIKKKRKIAENLFGCKTHYNLSILKNKKIDLLVISTPTYNHLTNLLKTLHILEKPPKAVLIEKPAGLTIQQTVKIKETCRKKQVFVFVNYFRDFENKLSKIKKIFNSNSKAYVEFSGNYQNNASHFISLFLIFFGKPKKIEIIRKKKIKSDYILDFNLYFKNENVCYFQNKYFKKNYHFFSIIKDNTKLTYNNFNQTYKIRSIKNNNSNQIKLSQNFNNVYKNIFKYFNKKKNSLSSIENAIEVHKILSKCKKK